MTTENNKKVILLKALEYKKTARVRAEAAARLCAVRNAVSGQSLTDKELETIWNEVWTNR